MNKKGFTLIELLAIISILAILALIATPVVINLINESKKNTEIIAAKLYVDKARKEIMSESSVDLTFNPSICEIQEDGNILCDGRLIEVEVSGKIPTGGTIKYNEGEITDVYLTYQDKVIAMQNGELIQTPLPGLYDEKGKLIASWDELVNEFGMNLESGYFHNILTQNERLKQGSKLVIDSSVKKIGVNALTDCINLTEIIIPNSVTSIENSAFKSCDNLTEIIIPNSVTSIGASAFSGCTSLTSITIPNSVTSIGASAFSGCTSLTSITIPNSVTSIDNSVFKNCTNLKKIILGNSVTSIGTSAFSGCTSLSSITIPNSVTSIASYAFSGCINLKEVTIGTGIKSIGQYAFGSCGNLDIINYIGTEEQWKNISISPQWMGSGTSNVSINYNYVMPES